MVLQRFMNPQAKNHPNDRYYLSLQEMYQGMHRKPGAISHLPVRQGCAKLF
jgi:hypothetical protein